MQYSKTERHALEAALKSGGPLDCPACGARVSARSVPAPPEVSYVRHRVWIMCPSCKRTASIDDQKAMRDFDPKQRPNKSTQ